MPLFGSSSRASTSNSQTNTGNYNTGSAPASNFNLSGIGGSGRNSQTTVNIETSDYGAISAASNLAEAALGTVSTTSAAALNALQQTSSNVINRTLDLANRNQVSETANSMQTLIVVAGIAAAAFVLARFAR